MEEQELVKSILLQAEIKFAIQKIDESLATKTFAHAIANVLADNFGFHNYETFINELKNIL